MVAFSRLGVLVGSVDGRVKLEDNGKMGNSGEGTEVLRGESVISFVGFNQAVYMSVS